jgi:hypothetical protein
MTDPADLTAYLEASHRSSADGPDGCTSCAARARAYLDVGAWSDAEVRQLAGMEIGVRIGACRARYGELWATALADARRRRPHA